MANDKTFDPGAERVGNAGPEVINVSGSVRTVNDYVRPAQPRSATGQWKPRGITLVRGLGAPGGEPTQLLRDAVTGQLRRGCNHAVLLRDPQAFEEVHYLAPNYSGRGPVSAQYANPYEGLSHADRGDRNGE